MKSETGFIFITVLMSVLILSILLSSITESNFLMTRIIGDYLNRQKSLYKVENKLREYESMVTAGIKTEFAKNVLNICGAEFYVVRYSDNGKYPINLESTVVKLDEKAHCKTPPRAKQGRQAWRMTQ